jgi:hypothetical protein
MQRVKAVLGYTGAVLTVVAMLVIPFVLFPLFQGGVAATPWVKSGKSTKGITSIATTVRIAPV